MGPRSFDRGNFGDPDIHGLADGASMGPRSFDRGNPRLFSEPEQVETSFNGAAVF